MLVNRVNRLLNVCENHKNAVRPRTLKRKVVCYV